MEYWTPVLILILLGFIWFIWMVYGRLLLNKAVWVDKINPAGTPSLGDIKFNEDTISVLFFWGVKTFSLQQIEQIKAFAQTDWGLEEHEQVEMLFDTGDTISFCGSWQDHREIVQTITQQIGIAGVIWPWGDLPQRGDKWGRDIIFDRNKRQ